MESYILPILIFTPLVMGLLILSPLFSDDEKLIRKTAKGFSILHFIFVLSVLSMFDFTNINTTYTSDFNWIETIGINLGFSIDSLSMLLIVLTSFIFLVAMFLSKNMIKKSYRLYYSMMLILECSVFGIFCAKDMFLFFLFWEMELIPMYILLLKWGSANKEKTAAKFIIYTFSGSLLLLLGFLILYLFNLLNYNTLNADFYNLDISSMNETLKNILFIMFFIGFGVKLPIIPFHSWLPDAHSQAATPVSIILSSILLKIGAYGILRFNAELFNDTFASFACLIMVVACINIIYASICCIFQKDLKRIIAYSGIAHMGIFLLAISSLNIIGFTGGIYTLISHAIISAGLFTIAGIIYNKCGTKNIYRIKGLGEKMPVLMILSVLIILSAVGVPFSSGFISEFLSFTGSMLFQGDCIINPHIITIIAISSVILSSIYILRFFHSAFFSDILEKYKKITDINTHQKVILITIILLVIYIGIFPSILTNIISEYSIITYNLTGGF